MRKAMRAILASIMLLLLTVITVGSLGYSLFLPAVVNPPEIRDFSDFTPEPTQTHMNTPANSTAENLPTDTPTGEWVCPTATIPPPVATLVHVTRVTGCIDPTVQPLPATAEAYP